MNIIISPLLVQINSLCHINIKSIAQYKRKVQFWGL